jgi:hypothetical protein
VPHVPHPADEFNQLIALLGDVVDGFESIQVVYADPLIESQLADLRYIRSRLISLIEYFAQLDETT